MNGLIPDPRVSIITPAYNTAAYLGETIASVQAQIVTDWEMFIVDDGSTDATLEIARAAAATDPRLRVITTPNRGQAAARNTAIAQARASLVALLDSDDIWKPNFLTEQLGMLDRHPDVAIVSANAINLGGAYDGLPFWAGTGGVRRLTVTDIVRNEDAVCVMAVFRRSVFEQIGGFDPRFTGNEDYQFWLRAAIAGFVIAQQQQPLGWYRRRSGSTSSDERRMLRGAIRLLRHASQTYAPPGEVRRVIRRQIGVYRRRLVIADIKEVLRRYGLLPWIRSLLPQRRVQRASSSSAAWQG